MWFSFGVLTLVAYFLFALRRHLRSSWGWHPYANDYVVSGLRYRMREGNAKNSTSIRIGIPCELPLRFQVKTEDRRDGWAKSIGIAVECQTGDPEFDNAAYIVSDDKLVCESLSANDGIRSKILGLLGKPGLKLVAFEPKHLWVSYRFENVQVESVDIARSTVPLLYELADALGKISVSRGRRFWDPFAVKAAIMLACTSAVAFLGILEVFRMLHENRTVMIEARGLFVFSVAVAGAIICLWLILALLLLGRSSRAHLVFLEILVSGGLGLTGTGYALTRDVNTEWDHASATPHSAVVMRKYTWHSRRSGTHYVLELAGPGQGIPSRLEVGPWIYGRTAEGRAVVVHVKPGFLSYRWIEKIEAL